jgi:hypothetical protein
MAQKLKSIRIKLTPYDITVLEYLAAHGYRVPFDLFDDLDPSTKSVVSLHPAEEVAGAMVHAAIQAEVAKLAPLDEFGQPHRVIHAWEAERDEKAGR